MLHRSPASACLELTTTLSAAVCGSKEESHRRATFRLKALNEEAWAWNLGGRTHDAWQHSCLWSILGYSDDHMYLKNALADRGMALALSLLLGTLTFGAADSMPANSSHWESGRARLMLQVDPGGQVSGVFVASDGCEAGDFIPIRGSVAGKVITLTLESDECDSTISWRGHFTRHGWQEELRLDRLVRPLSWRSPQFDEIWHSPEVFVRQVRGR